MSEQKKWVQFDPEDVVEVTDADGKKHFTLGRELEEEEVEGRELGSRRDPAD